MISKLDIVGAKTMLLSGITGQRTTISRMSLKKFSQTPCLTRNSLRTDYDGLREGDRVVSLGEKPYFDANSKSRRQTLGLTI